MDKYAKAIIGTVTAAVGAIGTALTDGHITATEWVVVASVALTALGFIWGVPNAPSGK